MSLPDPSFLVSRPAPLLARLALVCALSGALAGCFQPLYADNSTVGGPALLDKYRDVEIIQVQGRVGNELRNDLIYALNGGDGNPKGAPLQMIISVDTSTSTALLNSASGLPENQIIRVTANWRLVKAGDEKKKTVTEGSASGTATIDTSDQRFANYSAGIDAEKRAARSVADQIKAQLTAYFIRTANTPGSGS
ncbi:hypothetical protein EZH22_26525 [Xanthobacter dioxanivorans]|uniref:LPS-assembly lipoprotein n=1 Tax=Xanthobacter dioxanivorans TaxID=2528964 RepID=A0A974SIR6_9HYPH|nr:LPS assembly lipoprotein LptE [Xanthobacter dioxanivorans]QRG06459.1 hypothetical protein EZH22_26525 [Xanthobacter dioxanivorans]